jgi:hypothetical protein
MWPPEDDKNRAILEEIQQQRPEWLVIWGVYSRRFTAYPLFPVRRRVIVSAYFPDALMERMDSADRVLRIRPEAEE